MKHTFTSTIFAILERHFNESSQEVYDKSEIIKYLNIKTRSADKGSKSRGSFANLYAIYVLIEDYLSKGFHENDEYSNYDGAVYSDLFSRMRELPFGKKLQNHALNHRMNQEFKKYFPDCEYQPIVRIAYTSRYWINENLLKVSIGTEEVNLAQPIIEIIDQYVDAKRNAFDSFIATCESLSKVKDEKDNKVVADFIHSLIAPNVDARIFEIVSYAILKYYYYDQVIYFGESPEDLAEENLALYKTGRTNANDGGIDFVMKPLGRFFQVTETLDVKKYFLDIDKLEKYPVTFVIKSELSNDEIRNKLEENAQAQYSIKSVIDRYMECIEEIINIPTLSSRFDEIIEQGHLHDILNEIVLQSKVEFNYDETGTVDDDLDKAEKTAV